MEASANFADASILMRKIGFVVVLLRGYLSGVLFCRLSVRRLNLLLPFYAVLLYNNSIFEYELRAAPAMEELQ